jgi:hypothetical protein
MKKITNLLICAATLLISGTFYSCNHRDEIQALNSRCDSLQQVINKLEAKCICLTDTTPSGCSFDALINEIDDTARLYIGNYEKMLMGLASAENALGFFVSIENLSKLLRDADGLQAKGIYISTGIRNPSSRRTFRHYMIPVKCTVSQDNTFEFTPAHGARYSYSDVGCPRNCIN